MCKECILFNEETKYCVLFKENTNGKHKCYGCRVRRPMTAEEIINSIKESIEEWYKADEGEEVYAGYMLDDIYERILYETDKNYFSKRINDSLKRKEEYIGDCDV